MNNYKLADIQNLATTIKKRQGYKSYASKYGVTPFQVGQLIDWTKGTENGNFEVTIPEKGKKKTDWAWVVTKYDSEVFQPNYSWFVDVKGEGEGYVSFNETQNSGLLAAIGIVPEDEEPKVKVKKEAMKTSDGKSYSAYKFTLMNKIDKPE